ncbi:hypothetical protein FB559_6471 [Actinoallomurus bryophytorum]|uniref:Uncharacterized protein n=1 Tax=Actinoallomurus bryophytorum TaxID=1490222 RepID=A0A543CUG7_9ACTN|nr:hypothetical protein FB559_6471 [Actinoallomurus bryophytorum]
MIFVIFNPGVVALTTTDSDPVTIPQATGGEG